jgi:hypothetical protein
MLNHGHTLLYEKNVYLAKQKAAWKVLASNES